MDSLSSYHAHLGEEEGSLPLYRGGTEANVGPCGQYSTFFLVGHSKPVLQLGKSLSSETSSMGEARPLYA